ncbi:hypothetical protein KDL01_03140 [Actinospica durhamensis]|uniref:PH domain-containing protein n=1 Tax=Actinospica durhamensis TaxID=1508375 RepID=A0A941EJ90_9ACTN|nr:hypothetical protein [Actinospica durhamensis]MBR7832236.1 hypothetical protein [Actinospica durhamensis]
MESVRFSYPAAVRWGSIGPAAAVMLGTSALNRTGFLSARHDFTQLIFFAPFLLLMVLYLWGSSTTASATGLTTRYCYVIRRKVSWTSIAGITTEARSGKSAGLYARVILQDGSTLPVLPGLIGRNGASMEKFRTDLETLRGRWERAYPHDRLSYADLAILQRSGSPTDTWKPIRRAARATLTILVLCAAGASAFGLYNTVRVRAADHAAALASTSAKHCTLYEFGSSSADTWCLLTDLTPQIDYTEPDSNAASSVSLEFQLDAAEGSGSPAPDYPIPSFLADAYFGPGPSLPAAIQTAQTVSAVIQGGGGSTVASITVGSRTYATADAPAVRYTTDTDSAIAAGACLLLFGYWSLKRLRHLRGPLHTGALLTAVASTFTAIAFAAHGPGANSTSATADWYTSSLVLAVGVITSTALWRLLPKSRTRY